MTLVILFPPPLASLLGPMPDAVLFLFRGEPLDFFGDLPSFSREAVKCSNPSLADSPKPFNFLALVHTILRASVFRKIVPRSSPEKYLPVRRLQTIQASPGRVPGKQLVFSGPFDAPFRWPCPLHPFFGQVRGALTRGSGRFSRRRTFSRGDLSSLV